MDVRCDKCATEYEFDEERVGENGVTVKCTACGFIFKVGRPRKPLPARATTSLGRGPQGREWLVKKPSGQMIAFRELTTLQKWIVEGRIDRDDEISKNGETWKRLGNILELEPFFSVYEKARALNELIERGAIEGHRVEIRGSEVIAAMTPVSTAQIEAAAPGAVVGELPERGAFEAASGRAQAALGSEGRQVPRIREPIVALGSEPSFALDAPRRPARPARRRADLDISFDDFPDLPRSDVVTRFERQERRRKLLFGAAALVLLGVGGGVFTAQYGPPGNALQLFAQRYGLVGPTADQAAAVAKIEAAWRALDLDTLGSLDDAQQLLAEAAATHPQDSKVAAMRALALVTRADQLRRLAADEEEALAAGTAREPARIKADAAQKEQLASSTIQQAFETAKAAFYLESTGQAPLLALAEYYRVQQDGASFRRELQQAEAAPSEGADIDAALLYTQACVAWLLERTADPARATQLLRAALELRPSMNRARVLLARILIATAKPSSALEELDRVLANSPQHEEARRLRAFADGKAKLQATTASTAGARTSTTHGDAASPGGRLGVPNGAGGPGGIRSPSEPTAPSGQSGHSGQSGQSGGGTQVGLAQSGTAAAGARATAAADGISPSNGDYRVVLQSADRMRSRDHPRQALALYERAQALDARAAEPNVGMGWAYIDLGKSDAALVSFRRALDLDDHLNEAFYGLAEAYRLSGQSAQAREMYQRFIDRGPPGKERTAAQRALERLSR